MGLGAFCFTTGDPVTLEPLIKAYKDAVANATPVGDYVNDNILCVTTGLCMENRKEAFDVASRINLHYYQSLVFHWLDNIPKPPGLPEWPEMLPAPTASEIEAGAEQDPFIEEREAEVAALPPDQRASYAQAIPFWHSYLGIRRWADKRRERRA